MTVKILFASALPHLPQTVGGLAVNTHELIAELVARGHEASVLTRLSYGNAFGLRAAAGLRARGRAVSCDDKLGYKVYRARRPWTVIDHVPRHDVAVVQDGTMLPLIHALRRAGIPTLAYLHGLEFEDWTAGDRPLSPAELPAIPYLANSLFTAARFRARYAIAPPVVRPIFRAERYRTAGRPEHVTFINPVPEKGVAVALGLARACPDIPFVFVKGWPLSPRAQLALRRALRSLPNVALRERTRDMREIYATTRLLLVPSAWQRETWGRVASEAHCSGIPVLGSDRGGLPEAIGPGGVVLPADAPLERWAAALRGLWSDAAWYARTAAAARAYAARPDLDVEEQTHRFLAEVERLLARSDPRASATAGARSAVA